MFRCERQKQRCRVYLDGEITIYQASALKDKLVEVLDDRRELVVDVDKVCEIDTAGVQLLLMVKRQRERLGLGLTLVPHSDAVLEVFDLLGLAGYFDSPAHSLAAEQGDSHES